MASNDIISTRLLRLAQDKQLIYSALKARGSLVNFSPFSAYAAAISALEDYVPEMIANMPFTNGTEPSTGNAWYVSPGGRGLKNGTNWDNSFATRQEAVNAASAGDHIRVWEGTYELSSIQTPKALVSEYYGFNGNGTWAERQPFTHPSKHDALFSSNNWFNDSVTMTTEIIDGLWVQHVNGKSGIQGVAKTKARNIISFENANMASGATGGGVFNGGGGSFDNCAIMCCSSYNTGGVYASSGSIISNSICAHCTTYTGAGGLTAYSNAILRGCLVVGCRSTATAHTTGGAYLYNGSLCDGCTFILCSGGISGSSAGGVRLDTSNIKNTSIINCKGAPYGGILTSGTSSYMYNCSVINCPGTYSVGMLSTLKAYNCVVWGGTLAMLTAGKAYVINSCASNQPLYFATGADSFTTVSNFKLLYSSPFQTLGNGSLITPDDLYYSPIQNDETLSFLSRSVLPNTANPRPHYASPLIGAGYYEAGVTPDLDADGNTRPYPPSIGAYEYVEQT